MALHWERDLDWIGAVGCFVVAGFVLIAGAESADCMHEQCAAIGDRSVVVCKRRCAWKFIGENAFRRPRFELVGKWIRRGAEVLYLSKKSAGLVNGMSCQPFGFMGSDVEVCSEISYCPHIELINGVQNPYYERLTTINGVRKNLENYTHLQTLP